ncbi:MAG TPA: protein kinase [Thermoanaerobaculia bacterium]|nr:protein kinase [Thermoanaerobaculia bacterium]
MGEVYRAHDPRLGRDVAIKVLPAEFSADSDRLRRFQQEARAAAALNHPNILAVYDLGTHDWAPYVVSELLAGMTLREALDRGPLPLRKAVDYAVQIANGLASAHEKGIVHRDLKPDNIFLTRDGRLKILDFGIAKLTAPGVVGKSSGAGPDGPTFQIAATEPGMVLGTVGYMSPEQVRGEPVDQRSDLFSLGAIFHEMLTGTRAFKRNSSIETLGAILKEDPPDLTEVVPSIPPALERLVRRCLEKDREQRFQSARDLGFNLETLATMSTSATLSGTPRPAVSATNVTPTMRQAAMTGTAAATPATGVAPAVRTTRTAAFRPPVKAKPRVSPWLIGVLYVVSVAGAAYGTWVWAHRKPVDVREPQFHRITFRRGDVGAARFAPDGETIVYSAAWDGKPSEVFVATRSATEARPLGLPESEVLAVSKSELAVMLRRDRLTGLGVLARIPLAGGMPREVADNVSHADWSPDGANLAIVRHDKGKTRVEYPIGTLKYETAHYIRDLRVSPDGARLAILEQSQGEFELALIEKSTPVTIARGWGRGVRGIAWSPDGQEIWVSGTATAAPPALYAVKVADGTMRLVSRLTGQIRVFDISKRGDVLLSNGTWRAALVWKPGSPVAQSPGNPVETSTAAPARTDTGQPGDRATGQAEKDASWLDWSILADLSPDGRTLLFSETREGGGAKSAVYLRRLDAPTPIRLGEGIADGLSPDAKWVLAHNGQKLVLLPTGTGEARELKLTGAFDSGAAWMPDSRRVVAGGVVGKEGYRLHIIDTLDETVKPLTPENIWTGNNRSYAASPDGRFVAGMSKDETIVIYPVDGSAAAPLPSAEKGEVPIAWSSDGASLFVYRPTAIPARVHRITLATGARELWKEFVPSDPAGVYRIAPVFVTPDGSGYAYTALRTVSDLYVAEGLR